MVTQGTEIRARTKTTLVARNSRAALRSAKDRRPRKSGHDAGLQLAARDESTDTTRTKLPVSGTNAAGKVSRNSMKMMMVMMRSELEPAFHRAFRRNTSIVAVPRGQQSGSENRQNQELSVSADLALYRHVNFGQGKIRDGRIWRRDFRNRIAMDRRRSHISCCRPGESGHSRTARQERSSRPAAIRRHPESDHTWPGQGQIVRHNPACARSRCGCPWPHAR